MANQSMSGKTNFNTDPNHVYYDLQIFNNDTVGTTANVPVQFTETRNSTILANPSEYFLSIARFSLDTPSLPVFIPEVETSLIRNPIITNPLSPFFGQQDPNLLVYQVAFFNSTAANNAGQAINIPIRYFPDFNTTVQPPKNLDINAVSSKYYWVYQSVE